MFDGFDSYAFGSHAWKVGKTELKKYLNLLWQQIPDHPYRILIVAGSGSEKMIALFNLINHRANIDKIFLYSKDPSGPKYKLLINNENN